MSHDLSHSPGTSARGSTGRRASPNQWRKWLYRAGIAIGLSLLAQQAWQGATALQTAETCVARPLYFGVVIGVYTAAYLVQMAAWALIMRSFGATLRPQDILAGYALAFLPRYIPGSVWGYLSRNEWLAQHHGVGYGVSTTVSLLEAAMLLVTAGMLGGFWWLMTIYHQPLLAVALVVVSIGTLALLWYMMPAIAARLMRQSGTPPRAHTASGLVATTLLYLLFWGLQGAALVAIAQALCGVIPLLPFAIVAASALAWATGFLIVFVPAGLGVREWTLSALLVSFAAFAPGQATLLALLSRVGLIAAELLALLIGLQTHLILRIRPDKRKPSEF